jgi:hypothetical protein
MGGHMVPESIRAKLTEYGQEHILKYYDELSDEITLEF